MVSRATRAIEARCATAAAHIRFAEALEPANLRQCWSSYPFVDDQLMPTMQAVGLNGRVIATLGDVSQHAESIGFDPDPTEQRWISADWPHFFRDTLEARYGGVAIEMAGSVGSVRLPRCSRHRSRRYPGVRRRIASGRLSHALHGERHTRTGGLHDRDDTARQDLAHAVSSALDRTSTWSVSDNLSGVRNACVTLTNELFELGAQVGVFAARPGYDDHCTVENPVAANGATTGTDSDAGRSVRHR